MRSNPKFRWTFFLAVSLLFLNTVFVLANDGDDEDNPDITNRVARISFLKGNIQIKRAGNSDWEMVSLNSPLVEGDEIATEKDSTADIQFDSRNILHLAENSFLKIITLRDEGVAVSLSQGKLSLRVFSFDKDKTFFEIDAPQTTVAVQHSGVYRINAGEKDQNEIQITATEGAEARVYSDSSDFTLQSGKSVKLFISGDRAGDKETSNALQNLDDWDKWVAERDAVIAALLDNAYYDKYYDRDIYGAEELNNYGQWIETNNYGWVWKPYQSSISSYQDWTPYRYGHWSWISPYGWTWINDEPWGWATYHYGRWIYDNNYWVWTPYPYNRPKRSWWKPAIVVIANVGSDICWYPTPYHRRYHDYNREYRNKYIDKRTIINNTTVVVNQPDWMRRDRKDNHRDFDKLPPNAVVAVKSDRFGRRGNYSRPLPEQTAGKFLAKNFDELMAAPKLPNYRERKQDFRSFEHPQIPANVQIGAADRPAGVELNKQLENRRNQDRRFRENLKQSPENVKTDSESGVKNIENTQNRERSNNERNQKRNNEQNQVQQNAPERISQPRLKNKEPVIQPNNSSEKKDENRQRRNSDNGNTVSTPIRSSDSSNDSNRNKQRSNDENRKTEQPRQERQEKRSEDKAEPRREQPRQQQPKQEQKQEPKNEPKSEPKQDNKPALPAKDS